MEGECWHVLRGIQGSGYDLDAEKGPALFGGRSDDGDIIVFKV